MIEVNEETKREAIPRPLMDRVLVLPDSPEKSSPGGIVLPEKSQDKPTSGIVLQVGPGVWRDGERIPVDVSSGDRVFYGSYAGDVIAVDGTDCVVLRESDLIAVCRSE